MTRKGIKRATSSGSSEYSVGLVDGSRGDARGQHGVASNIDDDIGGKQSRTSGEINQSAGSVKLRKESMAMDAVGQDKQRMGHNMPKGAQRA